jgi:hypothetical protein
MGDLEAPFSPFSPGYFSADCPGAGGKLCISAWMCSGMYTVDAVICEISSWKGLEFVRKHQGHYEF